MNNKLRTKVWVDSFQTKLSLRIGAYLVLFSLVLINFLFGWRLWQEGPGDPIEQFGRLLRDYLPVWLCLLTLVPVMAWDTLRFTHRLVGPLVRFRQTIQDVARGEPVRPLKLRPTDYLTDLRDDLNQMLDSLQRRGIPVLKPVDPSKNQDDQRTSA